MLIWPASAMEPALVNLAGNTCDLLGFSFFIDLLTNDWSTGLKLKEEYPCPGVFYFIASILGGLSYLEIVNLFLFPYLYIFFYSADHI